MGEGEDEVRPAPEEPKSSDEIRAEIEATRMELNETVDALGAKLKPRRIAQEGWQAVKSSSEQGANRLVRIARDYPIPMSLIGVGVTWLVIESRRRASDGWSASERDESDYSEFASAGEYEGAASYEGSQYDAEGRRIADRARGAMAGAKDAVGNAAERVSETASNAAHRVKDAASQAGSKVGRVASTVKNRAADLGQRTGYGVRRAREGYWDLVERRPIAAGMATLAAGMLIGLLIPATRRERELMGETRDELFRGAKEAGRETFEKTKEVARTAVDAATQAAQSEAERQNLKL
jgi:hypothetical protein